MKKTYLVTGGSGFIGAGLVNRLVSEGFGVRVLDNSSRGAVRRIEKVLPQIEFIQGDIRDRETVDRAVKGVDGVFHLAFINGTEFFYSKPHEVLDVGVKGMVNILDASILHGIPEFILASSSEVYQTPAEVPTSESVPMVVPDPLNPRYSYGGGKIISELMAINYGRKYFKRTLIFRPHNVYGPDMGWEHVLPQFVLRMRSLVQNNKGSQLNFPIQGSGKETRAFVYIDDFIDGLMAMLKHGENLNIYHIGTREEISIAEVARQVGLFYGKEIELIPGKLAEGGTVRRCPDISKLSKLGYKPTVDFQTGVRKTAAWYDQNFQLCPIRS